MITQHLQNYNHVVGGDGAVDECVKFYKSEIYMVSEREREVKRVFDEIMTVK